MTFSNVKTYTIIRDENGEIVGSETVREVMN